MATPPNVTVAFTAEDRGVSAAINSLSTQLKQLSAQQRETAASAAELTAGEEGLAASMHEAKGAAALLGEELGIKLNRHLRGVLASSETLGPLLASSFGVAAAIGFTEVIVHLAEKFSELAADVLVYNEADKKAYDQEVEHQKELVKHIEKMKQLNDEFERLGKSSDQIAHLNLRDVNEELKKAVAHLEDLRKKASDPLPGAGFLAQLKGAAEGFLKGGGTIGGAALGVAAAEAQAAKVALDARRNEEEKAQHDIDELELEKRNKRKIAAIEDKKEDDARDERNRKAVAELLRRYEAEQRLAEQEKKLAEDMAEFWAKEQAKITTDQAKELGKRIDAEAKFRDATVASNEKAAVDAITLQQREVERRAALGRITGAQETAQLQALAQQKLQIEKDYLDDRITEIEARLLTDNAEAYAKDLEEYTKLLDQKRAAQDRYNSETAAAIDAGAHHLSVFQTAQKAIAQDITSFFTEGITQAHSFAEAFANLARSIIADLQKMAAEFIITALKKKLLGEEGTSGGGGGGGIGGFFGGILGALGHAGGGLIEGPGGPKSDVIPAMLSAGEFVMSAETVKALGAANLEALNMASGAPHLASGGFAGGDISGPSEVSMGIGLDEGLILRHLGSKAAGRVILQQLTNNPKGAQRALSRTD